jgi:hypothetical protein
VDADTSQIPQLLPAINKSVASPFLGDTNLSKPRSTRRRHKAQQLAPDIIARERHAALTARAAMLDRLADAELQHGHHTAAERLSWRAAELRGVAR